MISSVVSFEKPIILLVFVNEAQLELGPGELLKNRAGVEAGKRDGISQREGCPPRISAMAAFVKFDSRFQSSVLG